MSYLDKYKVGSVLFRTLSEGRMRLITLRNAIRHNHAPPKSMIKVRDYLAKHGDSSTCEKRSKSCVLHLPETRIDPEAARPLLEKQAEVDFPESFVLRIPNGRVLGEGTSITEDNTILSDTTTDFHRKQEHHHLLNALKIPAPEYFDGRLAVIASPGSGNYFHWTLDSVPRFSLLESLKDKIDAYYVNDQSRFQREWLGMLGISDEKIVSASTERHIQASELVVPSFAGLPGLPSSEGLEFVRNFMPRLTNDGNRRIYISRAGSRRRRILNEDEILPLLDKHGFETVCPGEMTVTEQMKTFASAEIVVSPHGAELTNLAYCSSGTEVIEIFSPYYLNPCFKQLAAIHGLEYTALVGQGGAHILHSQKDAHHVWANIRIHPLALENSLSNVMS